MAAEYRVEVRAAGETVGGAGPLALQDGEVWEAPLALGEAVTWGYLLLRERPQAAQKLRAYAWIAAHRRQIMASRRRTQALRRVRDRDLLRALSHRLAYEQTGGGPAPRLAHALFDPLFWLCQRLAGALVRW